MQTVPSHYYKISILYVEDEEEIREGYAKALKRLCDILYIAKDGEEGLALYKKHRPNIIITDIRMPVRNGIEMVKEIKKIETQESYILFTTAHNDTEYLLEALELQVSGYLLKPVQKNLLKSKIQNIVKIILKDKINHIQRQQLKEQREILQNILDTEKNLLIVTDFHKVLFANSAFLSLFRVQSVAQFNASFPNILDIFLPVPNYLHKGLLRNGESFYDLLMRKDESKRSVTLITQEGESRAYYINVSRIKHKNSDSFLLSLTDITKINIEKVHTERKAYYDNLTGVYNREKFNELFHYELNMVKRYHHPSTLAILDIDHFKRFNDTYGHLTGDEVLKLIAHTIQTHIRKTDIFARWGGEEFVLLLTKTPLKQASYVIENLRELIQKTPHPTAGKVTASFGVTALEAEDTLKSAFSRCDEALYLAKAKGRNRVESLTKETIPLSCSL